MKFFTATLALLVGSTFTAALPTPVDDDSLISSIYKAYEEAFAQLGTVSKRDGQLAERQLSSRNDLINGECDDIIIIWARGTTETGNTGTVLGPPFFSAVSLVEPGRVIVQGVNDYPADVAGYLAGGSKSGAAYMASMVSRAATQCPSAKIVLSGYSQGAQVTHLAAALIPSNLYSKVAAIILFGDPYNGDAFPGSLNNNVKTFCNIGDLICDGLPIVLAPHLAYLTDVGAAAAYVAARV